MNNEMVSIQKDKLDKLVEELNLLHVVIYGANAIITENFSGECDVPDGLLNQFYKVKNIANELLTNKNS